jgi:hypothetical protein
MTDTAEHPDHDRRYCGSPKRQSEGTCRRPAGWGTPHPGIGNCKLHGGSTPSHVAAAQHQQAETVVRRLWSGLDQATPVKDPIDALGRLAGALEQLVDEAGSRVTELKNVAGGENLTQLRAEVVLFERALGHLRQLLVDMARLGIASRAVEVQQGQADLMLAWLRAGLEAGAAVPADAARSVVLEAVLESFLAAMRRSRAGAVVAELEAGTGAAS